MKALVYTRFADGGVSVCYPVPQIIAYMTGGGGYWDDQPRGFLDELVRRKTCPELQNGHPVPDEDTARRFVNAMQWGGCTTAEALEVIAGHDCERFGNLIELQDTEELPSRHFRDAWKRSTNGGPVGVNLEQARRIQWQKIVQAVSTENQRRELDLFGGPLIKLPKLTLQSAIRNARDVEELERVWLPELPRL
jgi:hypothetical protein